MLCNAAKPVLKKTTPRSHNIDAIVSDVLSLSTTAFHSKYLTEGNEIGLVPLHWLEGKSDHQPE
jgi:hypothetical protein